MLAIIAGAFMLAAPATAATTDTAQATATPTQAVVGTPVVFTAGPTTLPCQLTWRRPDIGIRRFGGVIIGYGPSIQYTFTAPGVYPVTLDLSQTCAGGGGRLVCHSYATVYVTVVNP